MEPLGSILDVPSSSGSYQAVRVKAERLRQQEGDRRQGTRGPTAPVGQTVCAGGRVIRQRKSLPLGCQRSQVRSLDKREGLRDIKHGTESICFSVYLWSYLWLN